mgnify:CR=1 FL=1
MKNFFDLFRRKRDVSDRVSAFFRDASQKEKERVFLEVARKANNDQRELLREYDRKFSHVRQ